MSKLKENEIESTINTKHSYRYTKQSLPTPLKMQRIPLQSLPDAARSDEVAEVHSPPIPGPSNVRKVVS